MKVLNLYFSATGNTAKVADRIDAVVAGRALGRCRRTWPWPHRDTCLWRVTRARSSGLCLVSEKGI